MQLLKGLIFFVVLCTTTVNRLFAQRINDALLHKVAKRFEQSQHLSLAKIIRPAALPPGQVPEEKFPCYPGRQVTVIAVFSKKPVAAYGRMLVTKRYSSATRFDEHLFQQAGYEESLKIHYALLSVYFPPEATVKNCNTVLQVYDKKKPDNKVWLIVLTK